jgi:tetratricopeptide (TPR) repeat protein
MKTILFTTRVAGLIAISASLLLDVTAVAQTQAQAQEQTQTQKQTRADEPAARAGAKQKAAPAKPNVSVPVSTIANELAPPNNEEALYQFLMAEIAGQRGRPDLAARSLLDLATRTQDARVARRAAEVAFISRQTTEARDALVLWLTLEPESGVARQALNALLGVPGPIEKVVETANQWLKDPKVAPVLFAQLPYLLSRYGDKSSDGKRNAMIVAEMALAHPNVPEAQFAVAMTAFVAGERDTAMAAIDQALKLKPSYGRAAIMKAQFLRDGGNVGSSGNSGNSRNTATTNDEAATKLLENYLATYPDQTNVRVAYARLLVNTKSLLSARAQFALAAKDMPNDPEMPYAIGLISQQMEDWAEADKQFQRSLALKPGERDPILFNLGLVAEGRNNADEAMKWFREVGEGNYYVAAQLKIAAALVKRAIAA